MLLIAQPKSASTFLLKTLVKIMKVKFQNGFGKDIGWKHCKGFSEIQKYFDTTIKRNYAFLKTWILNKDIILKEYILPTEHHKEIIKKINNKIVILLRNPEDSYNCCYKQYKQYKKGELDKEIIEKLKLNRFDAIHFFIFLQDLILFNKKWRDFEYDKKLIITYEDLMTNKLETIKKILKFWSFKIPKKIKYSKGKK